jgi:hypothetical protein
MLERRDAMSMFAGWLLVRVYRAAKVLAQLAGLAGYDCQSKRRSGSFGSGVFGAPSHFKDLLPAG